MSKVDCTKARGDHSPPDTVYRIELDGTTGVYTRDFTNGKALCNLSGASRTITVNGNTITLAAYSGEILLT